MKIFKMPKPTGIAGRTSSVTNAFANGIIPIIEPTNKEVNEALKTLGMNSENICCAYCGDTYTEWDHFHPLIRNKMMTGYISEIHNLVPACGKCNQSKGNKDWKDWILSDAALSPKTRGIPDLEERVKRLEDYELKYQPTIIDFENLIGTEKWTRYWDTCRELHEMMKNCQRFSDEIKKEIIRKI